MKKELSKEEVYEKRRAFGQRIGGYARWISQAVGMILLFPFVLVIVVVYSGYLWVVSKVLAIQKKRRKIRI